jgi:2,4-dienoyl-CoA reductase (NADPH2)
MARMTGDELHDRGYTLEDGKIIAGALQDAGVAGINVVPGLHESPVPLVNMAVPPGAFVYMAEEIKKAVQGVPIITSNRINSPELAERIIAEGRADAVTMARPLDADPELPNKARQGRSDEIRPCIACNQGCYDRVFGAGKLDMLCLMNPACGREKELEIKPTETPKQVLVIGAGPGGMEAAFVASKRGHTVTLWERDDSLGGQSRLAAVPPYKAEINRVAQYYRAQLKRQKVTLELGKNAEADQVLAAGADVVILATGASPLIPEIPGMDGDNVVTAHDILSGEVEAGTRVLVAGGGMVGIETAEFLANQGKQVTLIEMLDRVAMDIGITTRWIIMGRVKKLGIELRTRTEVIGVRGNRVIVTHDGQEASIEADTIVLASGSAPRKDLLEALQGQVTCHAIGDCVEPRNMMDAIYEGSLLARSI